MRWACFLQIGLVDMLKEEYGIEPAGMLGHSAGEIPCGYADGCLTREQTILIAYHRGEPVMWTPVALLTSDVVPGCRPLPAVHQPTGRGKLVRGNSFQLKQRGLHLCDQWWLVLRKIHAVANYTLGCQHDALSSWDMHSQAAWPQSTT